MLGSMSNMRWMNYKSIVKMIDYFDYKINHVCGKEHINIAVVSTDVFLKSIVFLYGLFTQSRIVFISPKFTLNEIIGNLLSTGCNINVLITDMNIIRDIKRLEIEDDIGVLNFIPHILYSQEILDELYVHVSDLPEKDINAYKSLKRLIRKSIDQLIGIKDESYFTFLSPGTDSHPSFINIYSQTLIETALRIRYFFNFKQNTTVSIVANFESYPVLFTILGFITGIKYINVSETIYDVEEFKTTLKKNKVNIHTLFISSNEFKKIWDYIMEKVFMRKIYFFFNKFKITRFITNWAIQREISNTFSYVRNVHILNETLGVFALKHLGRSKIMFSSSYGFMEQGNFLAFKDPILFKHEHYYDKPGGTILKTCSGINNAPEIGSNNSLLLQSNDMTIIPGDICSFISNINSQGDRPYLLFHDRDIRVLDISDTSISMLEKLLKDDIIIRDCYIVKNNNSYSFYFEVRENLLDLYGISYESLNNTIRSSLSKLSGKINLSTIGHAIINLNGMRNTAGTIKLYIQ